MIARQRVDGGRRGFEDDRSAVLRVRKSIDESTVLQPVDDRGHRAASKAEISNETLYARGARRRQERDEIELPAEEPRRRFEVDAPQSQAQTHVDQELEKPAVPLG